MIGNILFHVGFARDSVLVIGTIASVLFDSVLVNCDWPHYLVLSSTNIETIITRTIFQTKALQCLTVSLSDTPNFYATAVTNWLMHTKDSFHRLSFNARTTEIFNIIDRCSMRRLEVLTLARNSIKDVESSDQKLPCLSRFH